MAAGGLDAVNAVWATLGRVLIALGCVLLQGVQLKSCEVAARHLLFGPGMNVSWQFVSCCTTLGQS